MHSIVHALQFADQTIIDYIQAGTYCLSLCVYERGGTVCVLNSMYWLCSRSRVLFACSLQS